MPLVADVEEAEEEEMEPRSFEEPGLPTEVNVVAVGSPGVNEVKRSLGTLTVCSISPTLAAHDEEKVEE